MKSGVDGRFATPPTRRPRQSPALLLETHRSVSVSSLPRGLWDDTATLQT
ncbi:hypothetical protein [Streptomyces sp. 4F14]